MELCCQCVVPSVVPSMVLSVCGQVSKILLGHFWRKYPFLEKMFSFVLFFSCFQVKKKIMRQVLCVRCKDKPENIEIKYFLKKSHRSRFRDHQPYNPPPSYIFVSTSALVSSPFFGGLLSVSWDFWYYP